jgi:hypothetical protein
MQATGLSNDVRALVRALAAEAGMAHGVPPVVAERASSATLRRFGTEPGAPAGRVRAYYWGVVRRTALGSRDDTAGLRARYLAAALADDLLSAGHPSERVRDEVARRFGGQLPQGALDRLGRGGSTRLATGTSPI